MTERKPEVGDRVKVTRYFLSSGERNQECEKAGTVIQASDNIVDVRLDEGDYIFLIQGDGDEWEFL